MATINDVEKLYNALKRDGYDDLGTLDEFTSRVSDRDKARKLYDSMHSEGYDDLGTADEFYSRLNPQQQGYTPSTEELAGFNKTIGQAKQTVAGAGQAARRIGARQQYNERTNYGLTPPTPQLGQNKKVVETNPHFDLETGEMQKTYITEQGNEYNSREAADVEQNAVDIAKRQQTLPGQLEEAYAERDRLEEALRKRVGQLDEQYENQPWYVRLLREMGNASRSDKDPMATADTPDNRGYGTDEEYQTLMAAWRKNRESITALEAERDDDGGTQFWRGFMDAAKNPSTLSFGATDFQDMSQLMRIKTKVDAAREAGEEVQLTDAEESLLKNTMNSGYVQQMFGENRGFMYRAGGISMQALPFVAEFMATGGFNTLTHAGASLGTKAAEKLALEGMKKTMMRNLGIAMGDVAAGFVMANTTGAARTSADIMERNIGHVTMDEEGQYQFEDGKGLAQSIYEGEVASMLEYYTEKLGQHLHLGQWMAKGLDKMGLSKLSKAVNYLSTNKWLDKGGVQDYPSEVVEEQANLVLNAVLVGDNNFSIDPDSKEFDNSVFNPKTQLDIWGGMMFSIGLMQTPRLAHTGYNAAGYYAYKHGTDVADANAASVFGDDNWQMIKEQIDNCDNENLSDLLSSVVEGDMSQEQKEATLNYAGNLLKMRGFNNGLMGDIRGGDDFENDEEAYVSHGIDQSYQKGHETVEPDDKVRIMNEAREAEARLSELLDESTQEWITNMSPMDAFNLMLSDRENWSDEEISAVVDYYQKQATVQGVMDAAADDVEFQVAKANAEVNSNTHKPTGQLIETVSGDENFFIVGGDVTLMQDEEGFSFNEGTGDALIVRNVETGEISVKSPQQMKIISVNDPAVSIQENETTLRQQLMQQHNDEITFGNPAQEVFQLNDTVVLSDGQGGAIQGEIGMMPNAVDAPYVIYTSDGRALQLTDQQLNMMVMQHNGMEVQRAMPQPLIEETEQIVPEPGESVPELTETEPELTESVPEPGESVPQEQSQSALDRIPLLRDEKGQPVLNKKGKRQYQWHKASVDDTADALTEITDGNMVEARDTATQMINQARGQLEKIRKQKVKGDDPIEIAENRSKQNRLEQEQQSIIKHWQDVNQTIQRRMQEETARKQAEIEAAKSEEQRAAEAEQRRKEKERQDQLAAERRRQQIEEDLRNWNKPYQPLEQAKREMADDPDAMSYLNDVEPQSIDEWVSSLLRPQSMMWADEERDGRTVTGLQSELGLSWSDMQRFGGLIGGKGKGKPFGQVVHEIWEDLPEGIKQQYTDQDVRNVLLSLFNESDSRRMRNLTAEHRIEQARQIMKENQERDAEYEMEAWAEAYHLTPEERETFEDFMQQPPTDIEQEIIDQIIADDESNRTSPAMGQEPDSGAIPAGSEGGEGQVQATTQAPSDGTPEEGTAQGPEASDNQPSVSGGNVDGGASAREELSILFDQIGANIALADRMSDYEVEQLTAMVDDWDAVNSEYGEVIEQQKEALKSKNKEVREAAQKTIGEAEDRANEAFEPVQQYIESLTAKYDLTADEEHVIPTPGIDRPRMQSIRQALTDGYRSGDVSAIESAASQLQQYVDEGLDDYVEYKDGIEDYEGNDPAQLADKYITHVYQDRYLDDDDDKEYINTGLTSSMRQALTQQPQEPQPIGSTSSPEEIASEEDKVNTTPTEGQKEAGNYQKGHIKVDGYDISIENPKGSVRRGTDANGQQWETEMHNTYGYIRGTEGVDGDHIDVYLSDTPTGGNVYVVDQINPGDGTFDEHKVMYGFANVDEAREAYLSNYSEGWQGLGEITEVSRKDFKKWIQSSHRKTKPFAEYKKVKTAANEILVKGNTILKNNLAGGDSVVKVVGSTTNKQTGEREYLVEYYTSEEDVKARIAVGDETISQEQMRQRLSNGEFSTRSSQKPVEKTTPEPKPAKEHKRIVSDEQMEELRKKLLEKFNNANAGIDVERMLLGAMYAVGKIERGVTKFADYAQEMVNEIGDTIRPYLKAFYNAVRDMPEAAEYRDLMDTAEYVANFDIDNFDKAVKTPDAITKAQQVVKQEKAKKEIKKVEKQAKQKIQEGSLFGELFPEETETKPVETETKPANQETKPANQETPAPQQRKEVKLRPATEADMDNAHPIVYHEGRPYSIIAVMRSGEQISATQFSKPHIDSVMLTNGKSYPLSELQVEDKGNTTLDKSNYETYLTADARAYFAGVYSGYAHPEIAFIEGAVRDKVIIPVDKLGNIPEIAEAERKVKEIQSQKPFTLTDEQIEEHAKHLLDAEHGSAVMENGKMKKKEDGSEDFSGPVKQERKAFVVIGRPAGGKSSVFANPLSNQHGARIIDSDVVKEWFEEFEDGYGAGYVQDASSQVADRALDIAVQNGDNIVLPRIGGDSVVRMSVALRLMGYDVQLYYNDVVPNTSYMRSNSRFAKLGRYLSLDYLTGIKGKPSEIFSKFALKSIGDYINECPQKEVQKLRGRIESLVGSQRGDLLRTLYGWLEQKGRTDGDVRVSEDVGRPESDGTSWTLNSNDPIFSYAEWKSNDVAFGEKPKEIWNSKSGKPLPGTTNSSNSNDTRRTNEQRASRLSADSVQSGGSGQSSQRETSEEAGQEGERVDQRRAGGSAGQHANQRLGHSVEHTLEVPNEGEETRDSSEGPAERSGDNARVSTTTFNNNRRNNAGERGKDYAPLSPKARFNANVEAIRLMRQLVDEGVEAPTKEQMAVLRQYSGWGGMGTFFNDESLAENKILHELLSDEEYHDAALSIKSAYYTPATVIDTLWDVAKALGFKGGNTLEGSAGIGNIIGQMPRDMSRRSNIEAVEIDPISGNILKLLYPDAKVHIQGFQDTVIPNGTVDLSITNVPFITGFSVKDKIDKDLSRMFGNIHDFCIAKNIRKLREGGLGIFISSNGTLDKSTKLREWIVDEGQSDVIGAFRLHNKTFGGAPVTSDIIIVRKRVNGQRSAMAIDVSKASPMKVGTYEDKYGNEHQVSMTVNDYFHENPDMMAGEMAFAYEKGDTFRPGSYGLYPVDGIDQTKKLKEFVKSIASRADIAKDIDGLFDSVRKKAQQQETQTNQLTAEKEGRMLIDDKGRLCVSQRGVAVPLGLNDTKVKGRTKAQCFADYQAVQKAVDDVLQQQLSDPDDAALQPKLDALNKAFDAFVKRYGNLHKNTSISFLRNDIDFPSFLALENYSESKDIKGKVTVSTSKAPLFRQRVLGFKTEPKPKTVKDAVIASIFRTNGIDLEWITERLNEVAAPPHGDKWTTEDVRKGILVSRIGFENPSTGQLEIRYKYLSGNVREKLAIAEGYNKDGKYAANVEELRKAVPMDIPAHLIEFSLGSSWIPIDLYKQYLNETYELSNVKIAHMEGAWMLDPQYNLRNEKNRAAGVYSEKFKTTIYGHELVAAALNNRPVKVAKQITEGYGSSKTTRTEVDQAATQACAVRVDEIKDEFKAWAKKKMQEDPELATVIEKLYNDKFNALVPMKIDKEFMPNIFEGANINKPLYDHQKKGVMRGLTAPTMLAHEVGTGKSFTLITTAMEMRRLGTARKPMIVVQNATVAQLTSDAKLLYPNAKILSLSEKDRSAEGRRAFYAKIKFNDWDIVIIPQSTFERIPDSPERELQFIQEKIDEKKHIIESAMQADMDSRDIARLQKELEELEQEYGDKFLDSDPANNQEPKKKKKKSAKDEAASIEKVKTKAQEQLDRAVDDVQYFDDLGVDALLIDEAHEYKHLGFQTSIGRGIKGIDPSYSKKCAGLYNKTRSVFEKAGWKNVVFATGTPISNTAAEIWTFMKYLMPADVMRQNDIYYFDDFVHNFGNIAQSLEFQTNGKFREVTRFSAYVNKPELIRIWSQVADTVLTKEVGAVNNKIPEMEGGEDQDVFLPQSPSLISIMSAVRAELERFENMTGKEKRENSSIPLTMYGIAKRAAIDPRLVNPDAPDEPFSKTNAAVKEIVKDLQTTKDYKGTVAVFCDNQNRLTVNAEGKKVVDFNIYDDMRDKLIALGVPAEQISIIKSGMSITAKQKIFDAVNSGDIRVVLGSTQTLGTGVNIQERLHLLIHIDAPDRPMDYTQRNGRIKRQGNLHKIWGKTIRVIRFGVEDSLDVTAYQRLKTKSGFIDSIMNGKGALLNNQVDRTVEEEEEGLFDNPVAVLSGSQYALKKNQEERALRKYQGKKAQWEADQVYVTSQLRRNKGYIASTLSDIEKEQLQLEHIKKLFPDGKVKTITIEGKKVDMSKADAQKELAKVMKEQVNDPVNAVVKQLRENAIYNDQILPIKIELDGHAVNFEVSVERDAVYDNGKMRTVIHKYTTFKSPSLREGSSMKGSKGVKELLDTILDEVITGRDYQDRISSMKQKVEQTEHESEQISKRVGQPFQFEKELEEARQHVEEYTELMKKEMEEKEAKYAAQKPADDAKNTFDIHKAEDSEDEDDGVRYSADEDIEDPLITRVKSALEEKYPGFNEAYLVETDFETLQPQVWIDDRDAAIELFSSHNSLEGINPDDYYFRASLWGQRTFMEMIKDPSLQEQADELPDFAQEAEQKRDEIITSDNFKHFFGDWEKSPESASKVVDKDGKPLIMYHGTNLTEVNNGEPFWEFYPDSHFGTVGQSQSVIRKEGEHKTYPVYLNIRNPKRVNDTPPEWEGTHSEWWEKQVTAAKKQGYDGLVYLNMYEDKKHPADSWIAFGPEQVKSAVDNVGTYDPTSRDIRLRGIEVFGEGETFPVYHTYRYSNNVTNTVSVYSTDLMPDQYNSMAQLLDAVREQYPDYFVSIENGRLMMQSWDAVMRSSRTARNTKDKKAAQSYIERKTRNAVAAINDMASKLHLDVEVLTTTDGLEGKKARSKGWFNPKTGKITIVLANHSRMSDVINTLLHEGVAHYGLRQMFGDRFNTFLDNVYNNVTPDIRRIIDASIKRNGWSKHEATEEYLARLAERTDFEHATRQGWWQKIMNLFVNMLRSMGIPMKLNFDLTDNELRYLLWRSYENLRAPGRYRSLFDTAKDASMQSKLKVGRYSKREQIRIQRTGKTDTSSLIAADEADDMGLLFRDDSDIAQNAYNEEVAKKNLKMVESWQDSMIGLQAIQDAITKETGNAPTGAENAYLYENRMHGRAKNMTEQYDYRFYRPMLKAFSDFCKAVGISQQQGMEYLISKSGLERNMYYAFRDGMKEKVTDEINEERDALEKQYSKGKISEDDYKMMKAELEERERTGVDDAMQKVRQMYTYQHAKDRYQAGDISYSEYLRIHETIIRDQLKRTNPKKDGEGNIISDNYYDDYVKDYSGLTETLVKEMYDDAQDIKKAAQRAIDPQERRALWAQYDRDMRQAYDVARQIAEDAVFGAEQSQDGLASSLWDKINAATKETLKHSYEGGLIERSTYNKVQDMFDFYIPLRGWEEDKASDVYTYMGRDNVFSPAIKKTWGRTSKAENPLAYIGNIAVSTILSGHRNQMKQHFLNYVMNNPTSLVSISESWYENIGTEDSPVWILRSADTAGKSPDEIVQIVNDFNEEMQQKQAEGLAMPVKGRLRLDVNATKGQKAEHVVEVQRAGHTYQLYINGDPKAAQALNGTHAKAVSRISDTYLGKMITSLNRSMAAFFTSKNPAFVISNLSRDLNMAGASVAIREGKEYNERFILNVARVLTPRMALGDVGRIGLRGLVGKGRGVTGLMPKLMAKWQKGKLNESDETERLFKEFMDEGGETGFVNMLSVESFKDKMKKEIREMNGSSILGGRGVKETSTGKALRLLGETFEFYNRCAEDATRFIVYMTSRQSGKTLEQSIADAKDVTLNFNRKGTGGLGNAEVRDLFIFVNPAIQALSNMYKMMKGHPLKFGAVTTAFLAGGALMAWLNQWFLNLWGDDDDKNAYWNLPPWVRKNNFVFWIPGTKNFVTIPLAQEFRVFYGVGEMMASAVMDHPVNNPGLEVFSSVADLIPINPTGNGGNLLIDFSPTFWQPLAQIGDNVDFTGKPIWRENQGNKYAPMYTKAYVSTPGWMVKLSEELNDLTGGNEGKKGVVEEYAPFWGNYVNNPAVWNHLLQGYFGGMYNTIAKSFDVAVTAGKGELPKVYQTPIINRFLNRPVERDNGGVLGEDYYSLIEERDRLQYELRTWKKKAAEGDTDAQHHIDELMKSDRYKRAEVIGHYEGIIKAIKAGEKAIKEGVQHEEGDMKMMHEGLSMYKQAMLEELAAIGDDNDQLQSAIDKFNQSKNPAERNKLRLRIERMLYKDSKGKSRTSDIDKAKSFIIGEEVESKDVSQRYLSLASGEDIANDARIRAAKARVKSVMDEYKRLKAEDGEKAAAYREEHARWFEIDNIIKSQQRGINSNKKLLGKGYDSQMMRLISAQRERILKAIEGIE